MSSFPRIRPLREQMVVVFGASSGIGRETAKRLASRGAKVVVAARSAPGLSSLVEEITQDGGEAIAIPADAADYDQVKAVADGTVSRFGRLDSWVHLAGIGLWASFLETTPEEFAQVIRINLLGQAHGARAALTYLLQNDRGGTLIHVSSVEAMRPLPLNSAYAASKHGVRGFVQALRIELEHDKLPIRVTEILPASIDTPLFDKARTKLGVRPQGLPPLYPPEIVAEAIEYALENPVREIVVGGAGKAMLMGQRLSPRVMDAVLGRIGFAGQKSNEPKSDVAPSNLYGPVSGYYQVRGTQPGDALATASEGMTTTTARVRSNPWVMAALLVATALTATALLRDRRRGPTNVPASGNGQYAQRRRESARCLSSLR